jgi:arsenate reductase
MAEGILRAAGGDRFDVFSAGTEATEVRPLAIQAMRELGIDISGHHSKAVAAFEGQWFDLVITVCDDAREACPYFAGASRQIHWSFEDPAAAAGSEEERLAVFRGVRDQIAERIRAELVAEPGPNLA